MYSEFKLPKHLPKTELDQFLARGWYRMGQYIFTTHFLNIEKKEFPAVWIRLDLKDYTFKRSHRKLMRKVEQEFTTVIRKAAVDQEKEALFKNYRQKFNGQFSPSLEDYLFGGANYNIFDSWEISVYDKQKLVATSIFDLGKESCASISSPYDLAYRKYSFGIYTLLKEIEYCKKQGIRYYYPGYIVLGYGAFDYKLRIGEVDYYDLFTHKWSSWSEFQISTVENFKRKMKLKIFNDWLSKHWEQ